VKLADWCVPWKISNGAENLVLQALKFAANSQAEQA
jgi:hypothetical protein